LTVARFWLICSELNGRRIRFERLAPSNIFLLFFFSEGQFAPLPPVIRETVGHALNDQHFLFCAFFLF